MKFKLQVISPLHIGSGEEINPIEYLITDRFVRIEMDALFRDPDFSSLMEKFIESAKSQLYIGKLLPPSLLNRHPLYSLPISRDAKEYLKNHKTVVKSFIKTAGRVYIPGSSLKGSILSAILWHFLKEAYEKNVIWERKRRDRFEKIPARRFTENVLRGRERYTDLLDFTFTRFGIGKSRFTHWLDITDSESKPLEDCLEVSLAKVKGGRRDELPILYETLKPGSEFEIEMKVQKARLTEEKILKISNEFYLKVLEKDGAKIPSQPYLLRLGQGSTAFATSFLILAEDLGIREYRLRLRPPKTRKRIDEIHPLGWVRIVKGG